MLAAGLACYLAVLLFALLTPSASTPTGAVTRMGRVAELLGAPDALLVPARVEFVANVAILVPAAVLFAVLVPELNWRDWTTAGFLFAAAIELTQGLFLPQRSAMFSDVVANTLGAMLGGGLVALYRWRTGSTRRRVSIYGP